MVAVSPFFATTRLLNEIRSVRARAEESQNATSAATAKRPAAAATPRSRRKPK
jgi:hypothetical protein